MDERPRIEFPCEGYPIKVIGSSHELLRRQVIRIVRRHDETFREETVTEQPSRKGAYTSVRLVIRATGVEQLKALHAELMTLPEVRMVL